MQMEQKIVKIFFESARNYASAFIFYSDDILADPDRLHVSQIHIQTVFLFPLLPDEDRSILCRLYYLREWLDKGKAVARFGLSPQNLKEFRKKIRQKKSERIQLKRRLARSGLEQKLTELQLQTLRERYLSLPKSSHKK